PGAKPCSTTRMSTASCRHPLGRLPLRLLPAGARPLAAVPPVVLAGAGERLRGRQATVLHQSRQSCRTAGLRTSPARTPAPRLGGLRQATVRRPRTGVGLSRPLHPSDPHRQYPASLAPRGENPLSLKRLPCEGQAKSDAPRSRGVHPPLSTARSAGRLPSHPPLRFSRQWLPR